MLPKFNLIRKASSAAIKAAPGRVMAIQITGGSDAASVKLTNDANGSGTSVITIAVAAASTQLLDFTALGGIYFDTKIYATITGTAPEINIWYE